MPAAPLRAVPVPLPRLLSLLPKDGVAQSVYQTRWAGKGLPVPSSSLSSSSEADATCRWDIKKVRLSIAEDGSVKGRAWGVMWWKGKRVTPEGKEFERIRGGRKYLWQAASPPLLLEQEARKLAAKRAAAPSAEEA
ncbi:hypothetical protein JCM21900_006274 [Sporobolomyces salmonicolor]